MELPYCVTCSAAGRPREFSQTNLRLPAWAITPWHPGNTAPGYPTLCLAKHQQGRETVG